MKEFPIKPIGIVNSCFKDKLGIPRQSQLTLHSTATLNFYSPYDREEAWRGIETLSHIWVMFIFHKSDSDKEILSVRPPRLGGEKKIGVFATRSPFRPNNIGQSIVTLDNVKISKGKVSLEISGHDLLDQTPILDIKPYIAQNDALENSDSGWIQAKDFNKLSVNYTPEAIEKIRLQTHLPNLQLLVTEMLELDPRPGFKKKKSETQEFRIKLYEFDIHWSVENEIVTVLGI